MNDFWTSRPGENLPWMKSQELKGLFKKTQVVLVAATIVGLVGGVFYARVAVQNTRTVLIAGDGRAYAGIPEGFHQTSEAFDRLAKDVLSSVFLRTERGDIDGLINASALERLKQENPKAKDLTELPAGMRSRILPEFVHPDVLAQMNATFGLSSSPGDTYLQSFLPLETRIQSASAEQIEVHVRGTISSGSITRNQSSEVYIASIFRPVKATDLNPLGWMLYGAIKMNRDQFYAKERDEAVRRATKTPQEAKKS